MQAFATHGAGLLRRHRAVVSVGCGSVFAGGRSWTTALRGVIKCERIELASGARTPITVVGPQLVAPADAVYDSAGDRLLILDKGRRELLAVDPATGVGTTLSGAGRGTRLWHRSTRSAASCMSSMGTTFSQSSWRREREWPLCDR